MPYPIYQSCNEMAPAPIPGLQLSIDRKRRDFCQPGAFDRISVCGRGPRFVQHNRGLLLAVGVSASRHDPRQISVHLGWLEANLA